MSTTLVRVTMRGPNGGPLKDALHLPIMAAGPNGASFWCPFCEVEVIGSSEDPPKPGMQCPKCGAHVVDVKTSELVRADDGPGPAPEPTRKCGVCSGIIMRAETTEWTLDGQPVHTLCASVVRPLVEQIEQLEAELAANEAHQKLLEEERRAANQARKMAGIRRERIKTLEARLRFAETRAEHWERRADRLGRLALEAMVPEARVGDPLCEAAARGGIEPLGPDDEDDLEPVGALS